MLRQPYLAIPSCASLVLPSISVKGKVTVTLASLNHGFHVSQSDSHLFCDWRIALVEIFLQRKEVTDCI
jgi:hypothetical protein